METINFEVPKSHRKKPHKFHMFPANAIKQDGLSKKQLLFQVKQIIKTQGVKCNVVQLEIILKTIFEVIISRLEMGQKVKIGKFGSFFLEYRMPYQRILYGERSTIPLGLRVGFAPSSILKLRLCESRFLTDFMKKFITKKVS